MPELPEVETVRTGLDQSLLGARIEKARLLRADIRRPITIGFVKEVQGARMVAFRRRAKYLLMDLDNGQTILVHLGMSGKMMVTEGKMPKPGKHDHAQFQFDNGRALSFNDARRFGILEVWPTDAIETLPTIAALGPEPFGRKFNAAYLTHALAKRSGPIKVALMDQALVVGVGNIYAAEALFRTKISPRASANSVADYAPELIKAIRAVLKEAIASGGSTLRNYVRSTGDIGHFQHHFRVYGREGKPCPRCAEPIACIRQAGRSTFFCPACQNRTG